MLRGQLLFLGRDDLVVVKEALRDGLNDGVVLPDQRQRLVRELLGSLLLLHLKLGQLESLRNPR